ncbi:hypothetical protein SAY86_001495 [Trapa natans]|uniref:UBA domain-containing protein n=1 Tax=Trapa natans TaxID=22666 RepID=A0AAN7MDN8_TRANT|nr:hypothetical protein SAY86_001495 [Trapa natans]
MPAALKSKSKSSTKAAKGQKAAAKSSSVPINTANGSSSSACDPISGAFHSLETSSAAHSPSSPSSGHCQNIDDSDDHFSSPHAAISEYDSVSNNGSCSGDSEDLKDKSASSAPHRKIHAADNERREKIRLKNEKKHQRQRERRALELHEKCCGYLMSRKLESLSQQLVNMGFSSERATLALILNDGKVEASVSWLFEGSDQEAKSKECDLRNRGDLKLDISEELARASELELTYKCSKQEVERAIVACEGDLVKAEQSLRVQKQNNQTTTSKQEAAQPATTPAVPPQRSVEREFNNTEPALSAPSSAEPRNLNQQCIKGNLNQQTHRVERRWLDSGSNPYFPSIQQMSSSTPKSEVFHGISEDQINKLMAVRETVLLNQRHRAVFPGQSMNTSPSLLTGCIPNGHTSNTEVLRSNMKLLHSHMLEGLAMENRGTNPFYHQFNESASAPFELGSTGRNIFPKAHGSWSPQVGGASSPSFAVPPSLGLFSGRGPSRSRNSNTQVDWQTGWLAPEFDYTSIDWTLDSSLLAASKRNGVCLGISSVSRVHPVRRVVAGDSRVQFSGWQANGLMGGDLPASSGVSREWTSPFAGKDIFSLPRQIVTSPSP